LVKNKPAVRIIGLFSMLSFFCTVQLSDRITTAITPNTFAAQLDHIEVLSYQMGIGLIPGQSLRITVFDPNRLQPSNTPGEPARARVKLFLADGTLIRQSPAFLIPEGGFNFVEFQRPDIPLPGDALTGRVQILAKAFLSVRNPGASDLSLVSAEVIDATTGKTLVYSGFSGGVTVGSGDVD
jgi:hypothetical protein